MQLEEMARVGYANDLEILVWTNDGGNIPHFHIRSKDGFQTCIRLDKADYFHHTGKEGRLNSKQLKALVDFLNQRQRKGLTNWELILLMWNLNNSNVVVDEDQEMPNYIELVRR